MKKEITNHQYKALRNKPEFLALVKAGRALNSITFAMRILEESRAGSSYIEERQAKKSITILAGFLHEGRLLAERLEAEFRAKGYTAGFAKLLGPDFATERKLLRDIRNTVSFHLDHENRSTKEILDTIESLGERDDDSLEFYESSSSEMRDFSFTFSDQLDFTYMAIKSAEHFGFSTISDAEERENKSIEKLIDAISSFSNAFVRALDEFIDGLINELGI